MRFNVRPDKETELLERMRRLGVKESDLEEKFIKGSGRGGQKKNKTSSCVYLRHNVTGIEVRCERERSQSVNRYLARRLLCDEIEKRRRTNPSQIPDPVK